jgi:RNA polymerase sigma factor (sigma-70 family)
VEATSIQAPAGLVRTRISIGAPLLRLRSDEQLVALFRAGNEDAFRVIHDRYRQRLFAYTRQMMPGSRPDAEDALQDIFVRAYAGLRADNRQLALRAWLYRVAHNRCVDELRRPRPPVSEVVELIRSPAGDPIVEAERRESLRRLIADIRRLPDQQRSALLMRELGGMSYVEMAEALAVSIPAVKSLLVRARVGLTQALEARDTDCTEIREELIVAHDRGVRPSGLAKRHLHDCAGCREFRTRVRGMSRQFAILVPAAGPLAVVANLLGFGGGASSAAGGGAAGGGAAAAGGGAALASAGALVGGAGHVATILAAAVVTAGGAVEVQRTIITPTHARPATHHARATPVSDNTTSPATQPAGLGAPAPGYAAQPAAAGRATSPPAAKPPAAPAAVGAFNDGPPAPGPNPSSDGSSGITIPDSGASSGTTPSAGPASGTPTSGTGPPATGTTTDPASSTPGTGTTTGTPSSGSTTPTTGTQSSAGPPSTPVAVTARAAAAPTPSSPPPKPKI